MALDTGHELVAADFDVVVDSSVGSAAVNFSSPTGIVKTMFDGNLIYFFLIITSTNSITATADNIADTTIFTLDSAYWPSEEVPFAFAYAAGGGWGTITTAGLVTIRTAVETIPAAATLRLTATYMLG